MRQTPLFLLSGGDNLLMHAGQKQAWFALRFDGADAEIRLDAHHEPEFDAWRWGRLDEAPQLVVPFKRAAYDQVAAQFAQFAA